MPLREAYVAAVATRTPDILQQLDDTAEREDSERKLQKQLAELRADSAETCRRLDGIEAGMRQLLAMGMQQHPSGPPRV